MATSNQYDVIAFDQLNFPYDRITSPIAADPRLVDGLNAYVTSGGSIVKRPGLIDLGDATKLENKRIDRLKIVETLDTPPRVYILASVYDFSSHLWEMWYIRLSDTTPTWTQFAPLRQINNSQYPHEIVVARGQAYVFGFPQASSLERIGAVIFDTQHPAGSVNIYPWGLQPPPDGPAKIVGSVWKLAADITSTATSVGITGTSTPGTGVFFCEYEQMNCTGVAGASPNWTLTVTRGYNSPTSGTTATAHKAGTPIYRRAWSASSNPVAVNIGWKYAYSYGSPTDHVSVRSTDATNPDLLPNFTGPFNNLVPQLTVPGTDLTKPYIYIWRTTDGGGTYYQLERIANPGPGSFIYYDKSQASGATSSTFNDPISDLSISINDPAPDLTTNAPPARVVAPKVQNIDVPDRNTPFSYYQGRIWYGIYNILLFSGQEEVIFGIPEESFPSGYTGNFVRLQNPIINVGSTSDALYIFTLQDTIRLTGNNRETFSNTLWMPNIGAPYGHPRAICEFRNKIAFLTHDFRVGLIEGDNFRIISDPLYTDIIDSVNAGGEIQLNYWADLDKEWIVLSSHNKADTTLSRQWIYDLRKTDEQKKDFWNVPWDIRSTCAVSGRIYENVSQRRLVFAVFDSDTNTTRLARIDPTIQIVTDVDANTGAVVPTGFQITTNLFMNPNGNHINTLRKPALTTIFNYFELERVAFEGDDPPIFYYFVDDFWTDPRSAETQPEPPWHHNQSLAYVSEIYYPKVAAQRVAVRLAKLPSAENFELLSLYYGFLPDAGD